MYFVYFCIVQNKQKQNQIMKTANEIRQQLESKKAQGNTMIVTRWISRNNPSGLLTVQKQSTHNIDSILNDENRMKNFVDNFNVLEDYHIA
jgi:DNA-binding protein YbaB